MLLCFSCREKTETSCILTQKKSKSLTYDWVEIKKKTFFCLKWHNSI